MKQVQTVLPVTPAMATAPSLDGAGDDAGATGADVAVIPTGDRKPSD